MSGTQPKQAPAAEPSVDQSKASDCESDTQASRLARIRSVASYCAEGRARASD
jgi:hypothetical protein